MALHGSNLAKLRGACAAKRSGSQGHLPAVERLSSASSGLSSTKVAELPPLVVTRLERVDPRVGINAPEFLVPGGIFAERVMVELTCDKGLQLRYVVEKLKDGQEATLRGTHLHTKLAHDGKLYRKPFVLDEYGTFVVHAMCMREDEVVWVSDVVAQKYKVQATEVVPLRGKHLATLPTQMVRGMLRFAGMTTKAVGPKLETMRRIIASASKTAEELVCMKVEKKKGRSGSVEVSFSVQVARDGDAEAAAAGVTDPSLVERISKVAGVSASRVSVEAAAKQLEAILLHLSWTYPSSGTDYLDGSCLVYAEDRLLDVVDYRGAQSVQKTRASSATCEWSAGRNPNGSVIHSGDVMSRTGGRHAIYVRLAELPAAVSDCFFTLSAYNCRNLSKFVAPRVLLFDADHDCHLLAEYAVEDAGVASAAVMCSLTRDAGDARAWSVVSYGQTCDGTVRDYAPIEASIVPVQARRGNALRRLPLVLLCELWHSNRAFPRGLEEREDVVVPCLELEPDLFRHVVGFL
uniref:TerD domain-containing protein n=1 Tax=Zooxanthella nutricula TaxID=1333877 RepID=A0A6U9KJU0_9DINO